jgi:hypothetical protein
VFRKIALILSFILLVIQAARSALPGSAATPATPVCGQINIDTTWTITNSPYVVCASQATVLAGVKLTIDPGVRIEFDTSGKLNVEGELSAMGTPSQPITFTGSTTTPGLWGGIMVHQYSPQPAIANLDWVTLEFGGFDNVTGAQLYIDNGVVTMTHSIVKDGGGNGVYVNGDLHPQITHTLFQGNARDAIRMVGARSDLRFQNLMAVGNNLDVIRIGGYSDMQGEHIWQNAGIPYLFVGSAGNQTGDLLTIEPGALVQFGSNAGLYIGGSLEVVGLPGQSITFTGQTATPGSWNGIYLEGTASSDAMARFEYATIEYGGSGYDGANVHILSGQAQIRHSIIRYGGNDGIRNINYGHSRTLVETSQIVNNTNFGLNNLEPTWPILANNNWWGDASGPQLPAGSACGPGGSGSKISDGIIFRPVLGSPDAPAASPAADDLRMLSIKPLKWFVPATGIDRVYVEITLRDGKGMPIPGRTVLLGTTLGETIDGGITGFDGKTLAYVKSTVAGEAEVNAILDAAGACELVRSPLALITFTPAGADQGYLTEGEAPYMTDGIQIDPMPVVQGVPTRLSVNMNNPNAFPVTVDGAFYYVQTSIGMAFGPLADVSPVQIPANGQAVVETMWIPPLSGRYCIEFNYTATGGGQAWTQKNSIYKFQKNLDTKSGDKHPPEVRKAYDLSREITGKLSNGNDALTFITDPAGFISGIIPGAMFGYIIDSWYDMADKIDKAINDDPPRQDYKTISVPETVTFIPLQPGNGISVAKANAANAYVAAAMDVLSTSRAAAIASDRYGGAVEADNIQWSSLQLNALLYYEKQSALQMLTLADRIDEYVAVVLQENPGDIWMTADIYQAYQDRLRTQGFTVDEIDAAHLVGMTDAEIEELLQQRLAVDPASMEGSVTQGMTNHALSLRALSNAILYPVDVPFSISISGGLAFAGVGGTPVQNDNLTRLFARETTFLVGNPYTQTATVELKIRPIDLPPDWIISISPASATLAPGESVTVTVRFVPGSPVPQATTVRFAVEGYVNSKLIGGVVIDSVTPYYTGFEGQLPIYLPIVKK